MSDSDIVAVDGPVIQAHDGTTGSRWEIRHICSGLQRKVHAAASVVSCLDCGAALQAFHVSDAESGDVAVLDADDHDLRMRSDT